MAQLEMLGAALAELKGLQEALTQIPTPSPRRSFLASPLIDLDMIQIKGESNENRIGGGRRFRRKAS